MRPIIFLFILSLHACSPQAKFRSDKTAFNNSKVVMQFKSIADMNDAYFEVRENGFFEFYRQLFDSIKNTRYPGKFTQTGDTLYLKFYDAKGERLLGSRARIDTSKNEVIFLDRHKAVRQPAGSQ